MTGKAEENLKAFFDAWADGASPLLLLDYDGTLAGFRVDRFKSRPWVGVRELLARIQTEGHTRIAMITGRPAEEINPMLTLPEPVEVWGLHGAERLYADGLRELEQAPEATQAKLDALKERLRRNALGGLFEDKANGAVMHWRGLGPRRRQLVEARARALFEPLAKLDGLELLEFESGVELRAGRNKGGAVEAILAELRESGKEPGSAECPVAFLGDDLSDESAFIAVNELEGARMSILVRPKFRETAAQVWVRPPEDVRAFLGSWAQAFEN